MSTGVDRYVGRVTNTELFRVAGYKTFTAGLFLRDADTFRNSVLSVLQSGTFKQNADINLTTDKKGFVLQTASIPKVQEFHFDYVKSDVSEDPHFMQVIAQFLVMTLIQMSLDLQKDGVPWEETVKACRVAVKMAKRFVLNPLSPKQSEKHPTQKMSNRSKAALMEGIILVLSDVAGFKKNPPVSTVRFDQPTMSLTISLKGKPTVVDFRDVDTQDIFMIFNANIAATLLLAARDTQIGSEQLDLLPSVLGGFMTAIRGSMARRPKASINLVISTR